MTDLAKLDKLMIHLTNVQQNCMILGKKLIAEGDADLGRMLIANGLVHDNSKFFGVEWDSLNEEADEKTLALAVKHHNRTNFHHPESWGGIKNMPRLYIAEMVCDWKARSSEFGTSLQDWIDGGAATRFGYTRDDAVYGHITYFFERLCDKPFKPID